MKIKTIDVQAKEWFDKINGNSYFSMEVTINYGLKDQTSFYVPMQYGYGDHYRHEAFEELKRRKLIKTDITTAWQYYEQKKIIVRYAKKENCKKSCL